MSQSTKWWWLGYFRMQSWSVEERRARIELGMAGGVAAILTLTIAGHVVEWLGVEVHWAAFLGAMIGTPTGLFMARPIIGLIDADVLLRGDENAAKRLAKSDRATANLEATDLMKGSGAGVASADNNDPSERSPRGCEMSDTVPTIEARYSSAKLWRSIGGTAFASVVCSLLGLGPYYNSPRVAVLVFGAAFCALCSLGLLYLAVAKRGQIAFSVGPTGIFNERISQDIIPWSSVEAISIWNSPSLPKDAETSVRVKLKPSEIDRLNIKPTGRLILAGSDAFIVGPGVSNLSGGRLLEVIKYYLPAAQI